MEMVEFLPHSGDWLGDAAPWRPSISVASNFCEEKRPRLVPAGHGKDPYFANTFQEPQGTPVPGPQGPPGPAGEDRAGPGQTSQLLEELPGVWPVSATIGLAG